MFWLIIFHKCTCHRSKWVVWQMGDLIQIIYLELHNIWWTNIPSSGSRILLAWSSWAERVLLVFQTDYFNSKDLNGLPLAIDDEFSTKVAINKSSSVIHIPTDVFSGGELARHVVMQVSLASPFRLNPEAKRRIFLGGETFLVIFPRSKGILRDKVNIFLWPINLMNG